MYGLFTVQVANESPLPVLIYNFPGVLGGIDLDTDVITELSQHANIVGVKLTYRLTSLPASYLGPTNVNPTARNFVAFGGFGDFLLQSLIIGGGGAICGLANVVPKTCIHLVNLFKEKKLEEAVQLQFKLAWADWILVKVGVPGTKYAIEMSEGYGGLCRKPLPECNPEMMTMIKKELQDILIIETGL
ncbi:L-threo-3-deoxy-hexylosonate aldolase [Neolecta irregularis DAH-3]|uniref:L-threo-3-deoxy-hexylosonate aldolase n=1 Tax=Neolecta irregularis (strain DAH-3) TaxID=1198029 RepID=A0A1U7LJP0_NEOID|nr:L-threo-3-deoxy-hexylosonate aldolase [Neolecta irregularis DAH-3]|eukprot:OLL22741.1 L-threo-3-deoxy-hexylosonate aldolase [Neolecta irregularis DAH-3]